ncbi:TadE/TadG family type IV pilus assembly protein [Aestuariivirga sp.]|uniref:TadE/TadG family type IV pilus assembly protein n=1 Tax=Aestuariivirga sp. TaxID=2650926 RepID=UPI003919C36C
MTSVVLALRRKARELRHDVTGAVMIWSTLIMLVLIGLIALAIDGARFMNLNSNLQEIADAAALAGAKELDGREDAITRARSAAINYLKNDPQWSDIASQEVQIVSDGPNRPTFFSSIDPDVVTEVGKEAVFIRVTTIDRSVGLAFVTTGQQTATTAATATAKSSFSACAAIQSYMCNPFELELDYVNKGGATNWIGRVAPGSQFMLIGGTGADGSSPGNWGLIDPPGTNGHNPHDQVAFWSDSSPANCSAVDVKNLIYSPDTGNNSSKASPGINVRFDNPVNPPKDVNNASAPIVVDGWKNTNGKNCSNTVNAVPTSASGIKFRQTDYGDDGLAYRTYCTSQTVAKKPLGSCPLPRDRSFTDPTNSYKFTMVGEGANIEDLKAYWANHHSAPYPGYTTRYEIYKCETDPSCSAGKFTNDSESLESSSPQCGTTGDASRRLINVAIVDCNYWGVKGNSNTLPIFTVAAEFFVTEPAITDTELDGTKLPEAKQGRVYAELVRTYQVNSEGSKLYHIVQLVR